MNRPDRTIRSDRHQPSRPRRVRPPRASDTRPITWIEPVPIRPGSRVRVVGFDTLLGCPSWLAEELEPGWLAAAVSRMGRAA